MKKSGEVRQLAFSHRTESPHGFNVWKGEDDNRRRGDSLCPCQKRVGLTKLFEAGNESCDLLGFATTINVEVRGAGLKPPTLESGQIILGIRTARCQSQT